MRDPTLPTAYVVWRVDLDTDRNPRLTHTYVATLHATHAGRSRAFSALPLLPALHRYITGVTTDDAQLPAGV
jgi:hypothetical protein